MKAKKQKIDEAINQVRTKKITVGKPPKLIVRGFSWASAFSGFLIT